jgi:hypothetical protein
MSESGLSFLKEIKKVVKISKDSVNWTEYNKWVKAGRPYEELNLEPKNGYPQKRLVSLLICTHSVTSFLCICLVYVVKLTKFFFKEPNDMLTEEENIEMEAAITNDRSRCALE